MRSQRRSLLIPPTGSNTEGEAGRLTGSEGMMTRAQRRRLVSESSVCSGKKTSPVDPVTAGPGEWRGWANLMPDLVDDIAGRLLSFDVAEYHRFRAVCKPWRDLTVDPRARALDRRFRPRSWIVLAITTDARPRRRLLNLATGASLSVEVTAFPAHCHLCAADGLLVLYHRFTKALRLLDPLSSAVTEFPAISQSNIVTAEPPELVCPPSVLRNSSCCVPKLIDGAGLDDSTSPPTLVLCLRDEISNIIVAKPGDTHWTVVSSGEASHRRLDSAGKVLFSSLLSMRGRCYFSAPDGSVYRLHLRPVPQLVQVVNQHHLQKALDESFQYKCIRSFLIRDRRRMMMVRYLNNIKILDGKAVYNPTEVFIVNGLTSGMELFEVDITGRRLVPWRSLGGHAAFVGDTHCLLVSTKIFPSIAPDAIYLGARNQRIRQFGVYHLNHRRIDPPHDFTRDEDGRVVPRVRPCNIDQYLICYVDRRHLEGMCINHMRHILPVWEASGASYHAM